MAKEFHVFTSTVYSSTSDSGRRINKFHVNDASTVDEANDRPSAAEFAVSILHDEDTQRTRAYKFCDYLNSLVSVMNDLEKEQAI